MHKENKTNGTKLKILCCLLIAKRMFIWLQYIYIYKPAVKDKKPYKNISWYVEKRKTSEERRHEGENNCPVIDKPGV
jgi:hypothetical protein